MKVSILNPEEVKELFYWWGVTAKICYATETDHPEKIGKACMNSGHVSGSRARYILFQIDDCPRFTIDQAVRHEQGVMKNVRSFRYVDESSFTYEIPEDIKDDAILVFKYHQHMRQTIELYEEMQKYVLNKTGSNERANEQARYILPMATHGSFVFGLTFEALQHFMNVRLCTRAEDKIRELARLMKAEVVNILPEISETLVPSCQANLWCHESKSCGAYPTKQEVKEIIKNAKCKD